MWVPLKWCLARMLPRELRRCTALWVQDWPGVIIHCKVLWIVSHTRKVLYKIQLLSLLLYYYYYYHDWFLLCHVMPDVWEQAGELPALRVLHLPPHPVDGYPGVPHRPRRPPDHQSVPLGPAQYAHHLLQLIANHAGSGGFFSSYPHFTKSLY